MFRHVRLLNPINPSKTQKNIISDGCSIPHMRWGEAPQLIDQKDQCFMFWISNFEIPSWIWLVFLTILKNDRVRQW
jgi:hypothetical protein